jgi:hypothetical protein
MALSCERLTALARISPATVAIAPPFSGGERVLAIDAVNRVFAEAFVRKDPAAIASLYTVTDSSSLLEATS